MSQQQPSTSHTADMRLWAKDPVSGTFVPVELTATGQLPVNASVSVSGADGSILDGASPGIKATVKDYANANPLAVINVDTNGDPTGGAAVSIADGADVAEGAKADSAATDGSGTWSVIALLKGIWNLLNTLSVGGATPSTTCTLSNVSDNASSVTVLATNSARLAFTLYNDSTSVAYLKLGTTASATSFNKKLLPGDLFTTKDLGANYTGRIDAIWATAPGGAMRVSELTA